MSRCGRALRALGLLLACTAAATVAMAAAPAPIAFIDAHVHLNDVPMQLDLMAANGIPQAVVFWGRAGDNATVLAAARAHPQKFIPFASVSPERREYRGLWTRDDPRLLETLDGLLRDGAFRVDHLEQVGAQLGEAFEV